MNNKKPVIVLGSGGHAGVVIEILKLERRKIIGLIDPSKPTGEKHFGYKIIGVDSSILSYSSKEVALVNGIGSIPEETSRWKVAKEMRLKGFQFESMIHPNSILSPSISISEGVQIMAGCILQNDVSIGLDSIINTGSIIDHNCKIGTNCHIAPGCTLSGGVVVRDNSHLGTGTTVIQGITIGENVIVGAGSVIYKNVTTNTKFIQKKEER